MAQHLVIQLARFGDIVQTKRLMLSLAADPAATVHLAVDRSMAALARRIYPFAVVHPVLAHAGGTTAAEVLADNHRVFADLRAIPFASVYNVNFSGLSLALAGLFDPDRVRGYARRDGQAMRPQWCRMAFRWTGSRRMAPLNLVDFWAHLHPAPVAAAEVNPPVRLPEKGMGHGLMAVVLAGRQARRSLPPEVLAPVVDAAFAALGGPRIMLIGSGAEKPLARQLMRALRPATAGRVQDMCGGTSLTDLADIFSGCDLVLTPDTGAMHLAAHCGAPVWTFFLSSAWCFETGPYGAGHSIWQATRPCAPCVETSPCPHATACLAPFRDAGFIEGLRRNGQASLPHGLLRLTSVTDKLGVDYVPACDAEDLPALSELPRRAALRALLGEYLDCAPFAVGGVAEAGVTDRAGDDPGLAAWAAETLLHESDWVLPRQRPYIPFGME